MKRIPHLPRRVGAALLALAVCGILLSVSLIDAETQTIPDRLNLALAVCGAVLLLLAEPLQEIRDFFTQLSDWGGLPVELFAPLVKTVGIALVSRTGSDLCRDAGESALASVVETAGTLCALLAALPLLRAVLDMLLELMG